MFKDELASPGFVKTGRDAEPSLSASQRSALVRKGNELFNAGQIEQAKRIFITARYTDGLVRMGDYYAKKNRPLDAFRMYWIAPDRGKSEYMIERMACVVRTWLKEGIDG